MSGRDSKLNFRHVAIVLALALAARLLVLWFVCSHFSADWFFHRGMEMGLLAHSVLEGKGLGSPFGGETGPTAFIAPGYPLFVTAVFYIFGSYTLASAIVIMAIHVVMSLLTVLFIMRVSARLLDSGTAIFAGVIWAISLPLIWMPTIFWETNFSAFFIIAGVDFALRIRDDPKNQQFVMAGVYLALAGLTNPAILPALFMIVVWAALQCWPSRPYGLVAATVAFIIAFSPWPLRNAQVFHAFIPLRSTVGFEMWMGNHPGSTGYLDESLFPTFNANELREYVRVGEVAYVRNKSAEAKQYIRSYPGTFVILTLRRIARFWTGSGSIGGSLFFVVHACVTTVGGLAGLALFAKSQKSVAILCLLPLVLFPIPYYIRHAEFRYRLIVDPLMTVFAAYAVREAIHYLQKRGSYAFPAGQPSR